ncbi:AlpA family phage regulatory protein [Pseudomaricurvus alcaniphilus]|nr:AlpA family phage regulatory protein [Pseudomaricurvus alcaniphilus]
MKYIEPTPEQRLQVLKASNSTDGLIDRPQLRKILPVSDPTLWRLTQTGEFPPRAKLGRKCAWRLSSVLWFCHLLEQGGQK